ncbi:hypothetical protein V6R21_26360 [Limibacter armeniacum]|uniref:hypothetical protein n=1 Tax=Limibacter armeniacum TaxID=466084 RepID=UPI002FE5514F
MKKHLIFLFLSFVVSPVTFAQNLVVDMIDPYAQNVSLIYGNKELSKIEGTPFFSEIWLLGTMKLKSGEVFTEVSMNYNVYNDELHIMRKDKEIVVPKKQLQAFAFELPSLCEFEKVTVGGTQKWMQKIYMGEVQVYRQYTRRLNLYDEVQNGGYGAQKKDAFGELEDTFWVRTQEGAELKEVRMNKSTIYSLYPNQKNEIKSYMSKHKKCLKDMGQMAELFAYCEGLQ